MKKLENKKILYLVTQTKWGGAQKYVLELAEYFSQNNEVHIAFGEINEQNQEFLAQCQKIGVKTIPIKNRFIFKLSAMFLFGSAFGN